jgi:hypothetical protein
MFSNRIHGLRASFFYQSVDYRFALSNSTLGGCTFLKNLFSASVGQSWHARPLNQPPALEQHPRQRPQQHARSVAAPIRYLVGMDFKMLRQFGQCLVSGHRCHRHFALNAAECFRLVPLPFSAP